MQFNVLTTDPYKAFSYLCYELWPDVIITEFKYYCTKRDIEKFLKHINKSDNLNYDIDLNIQFDRLSAKFTKYEVENAISTYFSKDGLAYFVDYLFSKYIK